MHTYEHKPNVDNHSHQGIDEVLGCHILCGSSWRRGVLGHDGSDKHADTSACVCDHVHVDVRPDKETAPHTDPHDAKRAERERESSRARERERERTLNANRELECSLRGRIDRLLCLSQGTYDRKTTCKHENNHIQCDVSCSCRYSASLARQSSCFVLGYTHNNVIATVGQGAVHVHLLFVVNGQPKTLTKDDSKELDRHDQEKGTRGSG